MSPERILKPFVALIPWLVAGGLLFGLLAIRFPADGVAAFSFPFDGRSPWFTPFQPGERVTSPGKQPDGWSGQRILAQPVYASARLPGAYDSVKVSFDLRTVRQPLLELGLLRDEATFAFESHPLWSEILSRGWHEVTVDGVHGWVRDGLPERVLVESPFEKMLVWGATSTSPERSDPAGAMRRYDISLRGAHDFHVAPAGGGIRFRFSLQDVNRSREGKNLVAFRVTKDDELIWTGAGSASGLGDERPSVVFEREVALNGLEPGVYRLSVVADDDLFIRSIETDAVHWVIGPRLYFGDMVGWRATSTPAVAWTNSRHISIDTFHKEGLQFVRLGSTELQIKKTHTPYSLNRAAGEGAEDQLFSAPSGTVRLIGDGYFAFDRSALFLPRPRRLTADSDPAAEGIDAILTPYRTPLVFSDGWVRTGTEFAIADARGDLKFSLAAPGIDVRNGAVDIRSAELRYRRPAIGWSGWLELLKREALLAWRRL